MKLMTSIFLLIATTTSGQEAEVGRGGEVGMLVIDPHVDLGGDVNLGVKVGTLASGLVEAVSVDLGGVDSLRLPAEMTLEGLVRRLEEQLAGIDRPLLIERRWKLVENYYRYRDGRRELALLDSVRVNLRQVYLLNRRLAGKGEISDVQVLSAHNSYLRSELEYLATKRAIRDAILAIVRLAGLELTFSPE